jgi:galactose oxidase
MKFSTPNNLLVTFALIELSSAVITSCPIQDRAWTSASGARYLICSGTDYQQGGKSLELARGVQSTNACAEICSKNIKCSKAVFDTRDKICHVKDDANAAMTFWNPDARFDAIRLDKTIANGTPITACPIQDKVWTSGSGTSYLICSGSDYTQGGKSLELVKGVQSTNACAELCSKNIKCSKAVYDARDNICHIKDSANAATTFWKTDTRFDAIRIGKAAVADGTSIASCPIEETKYHAPKGAQYQICRDSDYVGQSVKMINKCTTVNACADLCSTTNGCQKAVFDKVNNVCHIKAAESQTSLFWVKSQQFDVIRVGSTPDPKRLGKWSDIIRFPLIPVAAYVVPQFPESTKLHFFSSWGVDAFGGASGLTQFGGYDLKTKEVSARQVANTHHDMFCPGISQLQDGRILIQGGSDAEAVSIYDPTTDNFTRGPDMKVARGYQTSTILSNGKVFTIGGAYSGRREGKNGEIYDPVANSWKMLPEADVKPMLTKDREGIWREDNHGWLFGWKKGSVFQAGPSMDQHWYGTDGTGSVTKAGTRDTEHAMCGIWVMYDATQGKILSAGGSPDYTNSVANKHAHITTIGEPNTPSVVEKVPDMIYPRGFANAVVLPDGTVLVTGGQRKSVVFTNTDGILYPELFNPATKSWTQLAPQAVPRNYHSVSILLPDATVFSGGGGLCYVAQIGRSSARCDKTVDHADGEIFEPPYLFNADGSPATRPAISNLAESSVKVGASLKFRVESMDGIGGVSLIRMGSVTHSVNSDQRRIPLTGLQVNGKEYTVKLPTDSGVLLPGYYYLFVTNPQGTPSVAKTVQIKL